MWQPHLTSFSCWGYFPHSFTNSSEKFTQSYLKSQSQDSRFPIEPFWALLIGMADSLHIIVLHVSQKIGNYCFCAALPAEYPNSQTGNSLTPPHLFNFQMLPAQNQPGIGFSNPILNILHQLITVVTMELVWRGYPVLGFARLCQEKLNTEKAA